MQAIEMQALNSTYRKSDKSLDRQGILLNDAYAKIFNRLNHDNNVTHVKQDYLDSLSDAYLTCLENIKAGFEFENKGHASGYLTECMKKRFLNISKKQVNDEYLSLKNADIITDNTIGQDLYPINQEKEVSVLNKKLFQYILTYKKLDKQDLARIKKDKSKVQAISLDRSEKQIRLFDERQDLEKEIKRSKPYFFTKKERLLIIQYYEKEMSRSELMGHYGISKQGITNKITRLNNKINLLPISNDKNEYMITAQSKNSHSYWPDTTIKTSVSLLRKHRNNPDHTDKDNLTWLDKYRDNSRKAKKKHLKNGASVEPLDINPKSKLNNGLNVLQTVKQDVKGIKSTTFGSGIKNGYNPSLDLTRTDVNKLETEVITPWQIIPVLKRVYFNQSPEPALFGRTVKSIIPKAKPKRVFNHLDIHIGNAELNKPINLEHASRIKTAAKCFNVCPFLNV